MEVHVTYKAGRFIISLGQPDDCIYGYGRTIQEAIHNLSENVVEVVYDELRGTNGIISTSN